MVEVASKCPRCGWVMGHSCPNCGFPSKEDYRGTPRSVTFRVKGDGGLKTGPQEH